jgi:hypothetical protein
MFGRQRTRRPEYYRAEELSASGSGILRFPDKPQPHTMLLVFKRYSYEDFSNGTFNRLQTTGSNRSRAGSSRQSGISLRSTKTIELPFPKQLVDTTGLIVNNMSRDPLMESAATALNNFAQGGNSNLSDIPGLLQSGGADVARAMASGSSTGLGSAINSVAEGIAKTSTYDAATIAQYLLRKMPLGIGDSIAPSINLATGQTLNPRETLNFEGVQLRSHQFDWDLYPSNQDDSERIREITNAFKRFALPVTEDIGSGATSIARAFLRYPHICSAYLIGVNKDHFMQFKPSMIQNITVNYAAGGQVSIMKGGKPQGVSISLQMQEMQIQTAEDFGAERPAQSEATALYDMEADILNRAATGRGF